MHFPDAPGCHSCRETRSSAMPFDRHRPGESGTSLINSRCSLSRSARPGLASSSGRCLRPPNEGLVRTAWLAIHLRPRDPARRIASSTIDNLCAHRQSPLPRALAGEEGHGIRVREPAPPYWPELDPIASGRLAPRTTCCCHTQQGQHNSDSALSALRRLAILMCYRPDRLHHCRQCVYPRTGFEAQLR